MLLAVVQTGKGAIIVYLKKNLIYKTLQSNVYKDNEKTN